MPLYDNTPSYVEYNVHTQGYLLLVEKEDPLADLTRLLGHALGAPDLDLTTPIEIPKQVLEGGELVTKLVRVRGERVRSYSIPVGLPAGNWMQTALSSQLSNWNRQKRDLYLVYLCPDATKAHFWHVPSPSYGSITPGDFQTVEDDGVGITATSTVQAETLDLYFELKFSRVQDIADALHAVGYIPSECASDTVPNRIGLYGGIATDGTLYKTINRFGTATGASIAPTLTTNIVTSVLATASFYLIGYTDVLDLATAVAGGAKISRDGGTTWADAKDDTGAAITDPIGAIIEENGSYLLVGKGGAIWRSTDGENYVEVTNTVNAADFYAGAYDAVNDVVYLVGENAAGTAGIAMTLTGEALVDITTQVGSAAAVLGAVGVLGPGHIIIGDATGVVYETTDVDSGDWVETTVSNAAINAVGGSKARTMLTSGSKIFERSNLTQRSFSERAIAGGITISGTYTAMAVGSKFGTEAFAGFNDFVFVTDAGEIVVARPFYTFID